MLLIFCGVLLILLWCVIDLLWCVTDLLWFNIVAECRTTIHRAPFPGADARVGHPEEAYCVPLQSQRQRLQAFGTSHERHQKSRPTTRTLQGW